MNSIEERLSELGMIKAGYWKIADGNLSLTLSRYKTRSKLIYLFASTDEILYIGKTSLQLQRRLYGYKRPGKRQTTNIRIKEKLVQELKSKPQIDIYILAPDKRYTFKGLEIDLYSGLEEPLILELLPSWNTLGM